MEIMSLTWTIANQNFITGRIDMEPIACVVLLCATIIIVANMLTTKGITFYKHDYYTDNTVQQPFDYKKISDDKDLEEEVSEAYAITREFQKLFLDDDQLEKEDTDGR